MTIKEGRYYLDGMGVVRGPMVPSGLGNYPHECKTTSETYRSSGVWGHMSDSARSLTTECDKDGNLINNKTENTMTQQDRIKAAIKLLCADECTKGGSKKIVIADKGFVYVGRVTESEGGIIIHDAQNIRRWGTTKGLGELRSGPTESTKHDPYGTVRVPIGSVVSVIDCTGDTKW